MRAARAALGALLLLTLGTTANAATFTIRPQAGFDDQTPVSPTPGNPATTLGAARLNVIKKAGDIWGSLLVSNVPIVVDASFEPLDCDATTATVATGQPTLVFPVPNGPIQDVPPMGGVPGGVLYVSALADALRGTDLIAMSSMPNLADIEISVNSRINGDPLCLTGSRFYLGFDHNPPFGQQDLLTAVLHELAHGLGFISLVNLDAAAVDTMGRPIPVGASLASNGQVSSYDRFVFDETLGQAWTALMPEQRRDSAVRNKRIAWSGSNVNSNLSFLSVGRSAGNRLLLSAPTMLSPGSSIAHFDGDASPSILMEPTLDDALPGSTDVTVCAMRDIGWQVTRCPDFTVVGVMNAPPASSPTPTPTPPAMNPPARRSGGGGGGALYWPFLLALAGIVPLHARLRRRQ